MFNRRQFCSLSAGLLLSPQAWSRPRLAGSKKYVFIFCRGGWDPSMVFAPAQDNPMVDTEADAVTAEANGIRFVDAASRPSVRSFFERWGAQTAVVNGFEVRSITHDRCTRLMLTGELDGAADDWPSILAANDSERRTLPHLVMSGPSYTNAHTSKVVRMGSDGQFPALLSGEALTLSDQRSELPDPQDEALVREFLQHRVSKFASRYGASAPLAGAYADVLQQLDELQNLGPDLALGETGSAPLCNSDPLGELETILKCFSLGLSRTGMVKYDGWCANGWDTHSQNNMQALHYEELFMVLNSLMDSLNTGISETGSSLLDEVTVMVFSDMGRHPRLNVSNGKDHWTFTSAMFMGAGIQGGQVIGQMNDQFQGHRIALETGEPFSNGTALTPENLGASLLAMTDIDPAEHLPGTDPIWALMR